MIPLQNERKLSAPNEATRRIELKCLTSPKQVQDTLDAFTMYDFGTIEEGHRILNTDKISMTTKDRCWSRTELVPTRWASSHRGRTLSS